MERATEHPAEHRARDRAADERAIAEVVAGLVDAWERGDADAYGSWFTADATYTTFVGTPYQGRAEIVASHRGLFERFVKGTRLADEIERIRFLGPDTAVLTGRGDTYKGRRPRRLGKVQTYVLVREADGRWRIAAFHNTRRRPLMEAIMFRTEPRTVPGTARARG